MYIKCYRCLCEVCNMIACPRVFNRLFPLDNCLRNMERENCPVIKCDFFQNNKRRPVLRIKRRTKRQDQILTLLHEIKGKLDKEG